MDLSETVRALMQDGKGIVLTGESNETEDARLLSFGIGSADARREYHELLITTPGIEGHVSGIILSPEAIHENASTGMPLPELIVSKNILVGVSLFADTPDESFVEKIREYRSHGALFAFFSVPVSVSSEPVSEELQKNIHSLAECATHALAEGIVPILSPDISMYGAHSAAQAEDYLLEVLSLLADDLKAALVPLDQILIGASMAVSGSENSARADAAEVSERSVRSLTTALSDKIGGVLFLSDAQTPTEATANLNALARLEPLPWPIAFCFARALQEPVLEVWKGNQENFAEAQSAFEGRLSLLSRADAAGYSKTLEEA